MINDLILIDFKMLLPLPNRQKFYIDEDVFDYSLLPNNKDGDTVSLKRAKFLN